jgi:LuxR family transcriptional activator of conjugal transfer of Ti plasmids
MFTDLSGIMYFDQFTSRLKNAQGMEDLREAMAQVIVGMSIGGFIYLCRPTSYTQASGFISISSFPESWINRFAKDEPDSINTFFECAANSLLPFFWRKPGGLCLAEGSPDRLLEVSSVRIHYGWTVPVHDVTGRTAAMSFTSSESFDAFSKKIDSCKVELHVMAIYFHEHVRKTAPLLTRPLAPRLTPREIQCLEWAAQGKSRTTIAQIIGLSPRTIKFHLENAQRKLNVAHTTQAVLRASVLGLIASPAL